MEKCVFCDTNLSPGSEEHVFLSALGGRVTTRRATCSGCNNAFSSNATGKVDDALAEGFIEIRNGLKIWSGRDAGPPLLTKAGTLQNGVEFDLAPGYVPVVRAGRIPTQLAVGSQHQLAARDEADVERILNILAKRGHTLQEGTATHVQQKAPTVHRSVSFDGKKVWRCVAKTAVTGFVVLYGNEHALRFVSTQLRKAIRYGTPAIDNFAGWDFTNEWPSIDLVAHPKTPDAQTSGFEHLLFICDVEENSVAYVSVFGNWRFSVLLGEKTGLPPKGLAINPRTTKLARFIVNALPPSAYIPKVLGSFSIEHGQVLAGIQSEFNRALQQWSVEAHDSYAEQLTDELQMAVQEAGEDETMRAAAIAKFARKLALLEHGGTWETDLNTVFDEDSGQTTSAG